VRYIILFVLLLILSANLFAEPLNFVAPQFLQSYYDHYSNNYLNAISAGRGHTGVGLVGNIENALQNPAAFTTDHSQMYFEIFIKPPITEINKLQDQHYESLVPIGMWAYGFKVGEHFCLGANYSEPQSIEYNSFSIDLTTGDLVFRYPSYYLYQLTATGNYEWKNLRIGINLINQMFSFKDQIFLGSALFDRVDHTDYALRFQPGLFYQYKNSSIGASYIPTTKHSFDLQYQTFDTTLPSQLNAGIGINYKASRFASDINFLKCSEMSDKFKDRLTVKAGIETDYHKYTLRCGFMSVPGVWKGIYNIPSVPFEDPADSVYYVPGSGLIKETAQSMITGGFTWHSDFVDFTMAFVQDIQHNVNYTEVFGSMSINISKFSFKNVFPGDKKKEVPEEDDTEIEYLE